MNLAGASRSFARYGVRQADRIRQALRLSWRGLGALVGAVAAMTVLSLVLVAVAEDVAWADGIARRNPAILARITAIRVPVLRSGAHWVSEAGGVAVLIPLAVVAAALLWWRGARLAVALAPLVSLAVAGALAGAGKVLSGPARPPFRPQEVTASAAWLPSGHATDSTAFYLALALVLAVAVLQRPLARVLVVAASVVLAVAIAASRLVLLAHWPTEVIVGVALGATVALGVTTAAFLLANVGAAAADDAAAPARGVRRPVRGVIRLLGTSRRDAAAREEAVAAGAGSAPVS